MANGSLRLPSNVLEARVVTLERDVGHIEKQVDAIRETMATRGDIEKISSSLGALAAQASSAGKPNWQAMTVMLSAVGIIGTLVYLPINNSITDIKTAVHETATTTIQQQRYNRDSASRDEEVKLLRADTERRMPIQEYDKRHEDLKELLNTVRNSRASEISDIIRRLERLESNQMAGQAPRDGK